MWEKVKVPTLGVVENMSYFKGDDDKKYAIFGEGGGKMLAHKFNTQLLAQMPLVSAVRQGGDEGKPIVVRDSKSESAVIFRDLARKVSAEVAALDAKKQNTPSLEIGNFSPSK